MFQDLFTKPKEKWVVAGLIVLIILTALNVIVSRVRPESSAPATTPKTAVLSLDTSKSSVSSGKSFDVQVLLAPNGSLVDAVDVVLNYDTGKLEATSVSTGEMFSTYPAQSTSGSVVKLSGFTLPDGSGTVNAASSKGVFGTVTFKAKTSGTAKISFDSDQVVVASGGKDVLKSAAPLSVTVK